MKVRPPAPGERLSAATLAGRTDTSVEKVNELAELGVLEPATDETFPLTAIHKVRFVTALEAEGVSPQDLGRGIAEGKLSFAFVDGLLAHVVGLSEKTHGALAAELDLPFEVIEELYVTWGLPAPGPDERVREDDAEALALLRDFDSAGLGSETLLAGSRYFGENLRRVAESQVAFIRGHMIDPLLERGMAVRAALSVLAPIVRDLQAPAEGLVRWLHWRHFENYCVQESVQLLEAALEEAGLMPARPAHPPAIAFLDLSGFTRQTEEVGDEAAAELAATLGGFVLRTAHRYGGRPVKLLGDGVMFYFPEPADAVLCGLELVASAPEHGLPPARAGTNAGPLVFRDGDYFGRTVNVAARIADYARPNEVLVSEVVVEASSTTNGARFEPIGDIGLRGLPEPTPLYRALTTS
jgi:adenylate cyclase